MPFTLRILAVFAFAASTLAAAADYDLPTMGQPADTAMSPAEEERIGRQVVSRLAANGRILQDPELSAYIRSIGTRLVAQTRHPPSEFNFYVIDNPNVNAFALPGGYIGINAGLITETQSESELAGVMAHEIAHVTQRHIARQIEATKGLTIATAAAMLLAIIAGGGNPAIVQAAVTMGMSHLGQQQINFTRRHEQEADRLGIGTLVEAGYNPNGMASFFETMERRARLYGNQIPQILLTHPISTTRIAEARARAADFAIGAVHESDSYRLMRARSRVLASAQPADVLRHFDQLRKSPSSGPAADYGYALALMQVGRAEDARAILEELTARDAATHPHFELALADAQAGAGDYEAALATLAAVERRYPSYRPATLEYGEMLVQTGHAAQARAFLLNHGELLGVDAEVHELLARAADRLGQSGEAYYQQAEAHRLRGEYVAGIFRLNSALTLPDIGEGAKARLRAALAQQRAQCARVWSQSECENRLERVNERY